MIDRLAPYDPDWLEEPVGPDRIRRYVELRSEALFPIAGGEHEYTRFGAYELLDRGAVDILQPDTMWAGGITELQRSITLRSVYDVPVIPHDHSVPVTTHLVAANPATVCPYVEYLDRITELLYLFIETPVVPEDGQVSLSDTPSVGIAIDDSAATARESITFEQ